MHEFSIVQALFNQYKEYVAKQHAERITKAVTRIGMLSGGEPDLLQTAFDTFKEGTICDGAEFVMNIQPVVLYCRACGHEATLEGELVLSCAQCGSLETNIVDGEEMYLMSLEMEEGER